MDVIFDMETHDPDDALTLCLLGAHPRVRLRAVTVNPGTRAQVGVVRRLLYRLARTEIPIGVRDLDCPDRSVSEFHTEWLGAVPDGPPDAPADELLASVLTRYPKSVLLTGAPVHNLRLLLTAHPNIRLRRWVAQGGFAGDHLVRPEHRLARFAGRRTFRTFNFDGDPAGALLALESDRIEHRDLVSKNVTYGVVYDAEFHRRMRPHRDGTAGLSLIYQAMELYLRSRRRGKMLHDPLAACVVIDRSIVTWAEVRVLYQDGEWGAEAAAGTGTFITTAVDHNRFF